MSRKSCNGSLIELVNAKKRLVPVLKINRPPYTVDPLHEGGGGWSDEGFPERTGEIAHPRERVGRSLDR